MTERDELVKVAAMKVLRVLNWCPQNSDAQDVAVQNIAPIIHAAISECESNFRVRLETREIELLRKLEAVVCEIATEACEKDRATLEAQCAAMRAALGKLNEAASDPAVLRVVSRWADEHPFEIRETVLGELRSAILLADDALSTDAGEKVLEVMRAAMKVRDLLHEERMANAAYQNAISMGELCIPDPRLLPKENLSAALNDLCNPVDALGWKP